MAPRRETFSTERGAYDSLQEAEPAARAVLALLGRTCSARCAPRMAARLPEDFALILLNPLRSAEPLPPERFVRASAAWTGAATEQTVARDVSAALSTAADAAGGDLLEQVLSPVPCRLRPPLRTSPSQPVTHPLTHSPTHPLTHSPTHPETTIPAPERQPQQVSPDPRVLLQSVPATSYERMLEKVRYEGAYPTRERAEEAIRLVIAGLGRQLTGDERVELAARLPLEAACLLTAQITDPQPLTGWAFVKDLAARAEASLATTRWDTGAVLTAVAALAGPDLLTRILRQLPSGFALLFGRAELTPAA